MGKKTLVFTNAPFIFHVRILEILSVDVAPVNQSMRNIRARAWAEDPGTEVILQIPIPETQATMLPMRLNSLASYIVVGEYEKTNNIIYVQQCVPDFSKEDDRD